MRRGPLLASSSGQVREGRRCSVWHATPQLPTRSVMIELRDRMTHGLVGGERKRFVVSVVWTDDAASNLLPCDWRDCLWLNPMGLWEILAGNHTGAGPIQHDHGSVLSACAPYNGRNDFKGVLALAWEWASYSRTDDTRHLHRGATGAPLLAEKRMTQEANGEH